MIAERCEGKLIKDVINEVDRVMNSWDLFILNISKEIESLDIYHNMWFETFDTLTFRSMYLQDPHIAELYNKYKNER